MTMHKNVKLTPAGRALLVHRVLFGDQSVREVSRSLGVSRRTVYKWLGRFRREGRAGLEDRTSRPRPIARRLDSWSIAWSRLLPSGSRLTAPTRAGTRSTSTRSSSHCRR